MVNKVILLGNVGADPEIRIFENGSKVARVRLATTERYYNKETKEKKEKTEWHTLTLWSGLANLAEQYIRKGSQIYVEGRLRNTEWQDSTGAKRYGVEILCDVVNLLGRRGADGEASQPSKTPYTPQQTPSHVAAQTPQQPQSTSQPLEEDDDLPF
ncbi:MAG: single-stranded DNA-binding protein [Rikenellaceae bacterium]